MTDDGLLPGGRSAVDSRTVCVQSRELLDGDQEQMYLHFLATRVRPLREQALGPFRPQTDRPPAKDRRGDL